MCGARDAKGLYARARAGKLQNFTGINDPYEPPLNPELILTAINTTAEENAQRIIGFLRQRGFL